MADIAAAQQPQLSEEERDAIRRPIIEQFERESHPYYASARLWDDGVVAPGQLRETLILSFAACAGREKQDSRFGVFRM